MISAATVRRGFFLVLADELGRRPIAPGHASARCMLILAAPCSQRWATLLPSPTRPASPPRSGRIFLNGQEVGEDLTGMVQIGQTIDYRNRSIPRQFRHLLVGEGRITIPSR